jgi:hypothetical protein
MQYRESIINKNHQSAKKLNFLKELLVWLICIVATSIGPSLLISAPYDIAFSIASVILLVICCVSYHFIIKWLNHTYISIFGLCTLYGYFIYFIVYENSITYFLHQLLVFRLRGDGFFTLSMMHLLWIIVIIKKLVILPLSKQTILNIVQSSFEYWAVIMLSILIIRTEIITNSGEGKVIIGNVFLLYIFLQQFIDTKFFILLKNMIANRLKS